MNPDDFGDPFNKLARRVRILETHSLGIPFNPPTKVQTLVVDLSIPAKAQAYPGAPTPGTYTLQSGIFTVVGAGATYVLEGAIDAEMYAWDNTIVAPRREGWLDIQGLAATSHTEWPFGANSDGSLKRVVNSWRTADTAIAAGTYTARALFQQAGLNDVRIFTGYLRVTITQ